MIADKEKTRVVFRVWPKREGGGVIALFPDIDEGRGLADNIHRIEDGYNAQAFMRARLTSMKLSAGGVR